MPPRSFAGRRPNLRSPQLVSAGMSAIELAMNSLGALSEPAVIGYDSRGHSSALAGRLPAVVDRVL